jgi:hypothetical protein
MPRRAAPPKKKITGDPVYGSVLVQQLTNKIMLDGKKSTSEKIIYDALSYIEERTGTSPVQVLNNALDNIRPRGGPGRQGQHRLQREAQGRHASDGRGQPGFRPLQVVTENLYGCTSF